MKLLFDQNISSKLVQTLSDLFPDAVHVRDIGLELEDDSVVWNYARDHKFVIVSKDADFHQRSFLYGFPPKVLWVVLGNCSTAEIARLIRANHLRITDFN
ncbi:DUF5615 family PIN-like protein [Nitrospira defluvii]|nr:DUF5615 family PIN-like protein [Nitrospira defluvii]